jgi:hypothetical protein
MYQPKQETKFKIKQTNTKEMNKYELMIGNDTRYLIVSENTIEQLEKLAVKGYKEDTAAKFKLSEGGFIIVPINVIKENIIKISPVK